MASQQSYVELQTSRLEVATRDGLMPDATPAWLHQLSIIAGSTHLVGYMTTRELLLLRDTIEKYLGVKAQKDTRVLFRVVLEDNSSKVATATTEVVSPERSRKSNAR